MEQSPLDRFRQQLPWSCLDCPMIDEGLVNLEIEYQRLEAMTAAEREAIRLACRDVGIDSPPLSVPEAINRLEGYYQRCKGVLASKAIRDEYEYTTTICGSPDAPTSEDYAEGSYPPARTRRRKITP